jgi:lysophospholipase L1-like esterase
MTCSTNTLRDGIAGMPNGTCLAIAFTLLAGTAVPGVARGGETTAIEFRSGDRVALIGGTLIEREQRYGYWEHAITAAYPDRDLTFRNLGWSGDTVWAESRGIFDPADKGYERLIAQVRELRPTLFVVNYGGNEAWESLQRGEPAAAAIEKYIAQYGRLLDDLAAASGGDAATGTPAAPRFVVLTPLPLETGVGPNSQPERYNEHLARYATAIQQFAQQRDCPCRDLAQVYPWFQAQVGDAPGFQLPLTDNGLHLSEYGYWRTAQWIREQLCAGATDPATVVPTVPATSFLSNGSAVEAGHAADQSRALLASIRRKNELYFHRWRPQNVTYLFLFRKHEQGNNAVEIPQFDPLIAAEEQRIAELRRPSR